MTGDIPLPRHNEILVNRPISWRRRLVNGLQAGLQHLGIADAYARMRGSEGAVVLMYHSVAAEADARWIDPRNHLSPEIFARHVAFLARHRRVVSLATLFDELEAGQPPASGTVVITFDDGYRDNWSIATPLLQQAGLPATFFLATGYVARGENQWVDQLYSAFTRRTRHTLEVGGQRFHLANVDQAMSAYETAAANLLTASIQSRTELLDSIRHLLRPAEEAPRLTATWEEIHRWRREATGMSFGLHTRDHLDLTSCDETAIRDELHACRQEGDAEFAEAPPWFSFPYSRSNAASRRLVREAGFRLAFAREAPERVATDSDWFALPRVVAPASLSRLAFITGGAYPTLSHALLGRA